MHVSRDTNPLSHTGLLGSWYRFYYYLFTRSVFLLVIKVSETVYGTVPYFFEEKSVQIYLPWGPCFKEFRVKINIQYMLKPHNVHKILAEWLERLTGKAKSLNSSAPEFIDVWLGDKVNSGIGLLYRPASHYVAWRACQYDNPVPELTLSSSKGSMNSATVSNPSILWHSGIWGAADEAVLNKVHTKTSSC